LSDDARPPPPASPAPRRRRLRLRAYFDTWLLATFLVFSFTMVWHLGERSEGRDGMGGLGGVFLVAPLFALLSLPALWLLRMFRESSPSTWLRLVRRMVLGAICGTFPGALLIALAGRADGREAHNAMTLYAAGLTFGLLAGLVDAMHLDAARAEDDLAD